MEGAGEGSRINCQLPGPSAPGRGRLSGASHAARSLCQILRGSTAQIFKVRSMSRLSFGYILDAVLFSSEITMRYSFEGLSIERNLHYFQVPILLSK
jgi:hypothetical protein